MTPDDRRYSDEEFARVLRRAQEMELGGEAVEGLPTLPAGDLTLAEMRGIAREAGIDPELVARAAAALDREPEGRDGWTGGPTHLRSEFVSPRVMSQAVQPRVVAAIRAAAAHHGVVMNEPGALVWRTVGQPTQLDVTLEPGPDATRVTVTADRSQAAGLTLFGSMAAWLVAAGITGAVVDPAGLSGAAAILGPALAGGALTARTLWSRATRRLRERIADVAGAVDEALEDRREG